MQPHGPSVGPRAVQQIGQLLHCLLALGDLLSFTSMGARTEAISVRPEDLVEALDRGQRRWPLRSTRAAPARSALPAVPARSRRDKTISFRWESAGRGAERGSAVRAEWGTGTGERAMLASPRFPTGVENPMRRPTTATPAVLFLVLLFSLPLGGCGDDDGPASPNGGSDPDPDSTAASMTAVVDGEAWTAVTASAFVSTSGFVTIGASNVGGEFGIGLGFPDQGVGTYAIGPGAITNANVISLAGASWIASTDRGSGSIVVTERSDDRIVGTFSFTAPLASGSGPPDTRTVSEGAFDLPLDVQ